MTIEHLTFEETLRFCSPTSCKQCPSDRLTCRNCPSTRLCLTKVYSPFTGQQTALVIGKRRKRNCRCRPHCGCSDRRHH